MKYIFVTLLSFICLGATAQSWCTPGATWKYTDITHAWVFGYNKIQYVGTTVFEGKTVQKLQKSFHGYDAFSKEYVSGNYPDLELTYEENGVVYLRYETQWDTLYNFRAGIGDQWSLAKASVQGNCDSNSRIQVLDTGTLQLNGVNLHFLAVNIRYNTQPVWSTDPPGIFNYTDTIVERIGFLHSYMFPFDQCDSWLDVNEGGPLRCYSDGEVGTFKPYGYNEDCDYILDVAEMEPSEKGHVYPNPFVNDLYLDGISNGHFSLYAAHGMEVSRGSFEDAHLSFPELSPGMYCLVVEEGLHILRRKIIKL